MHQEDGIRGRLRIKNTTWNVPTKAAKAFYRTVLRTHKLLKATDPRFFLRAKSEFDLRFRSLGRENREMCHG